MNRTESTSASSAHTGSTNGHYAQPKEALTDAYKHLGELREYIGYLVSVKLDGLKLSLRSVLLYAVLGVVGLLAGGAIVATAGVLLVVGIAEALAALLDARWAGYLLTSLLVLGAVAVGVVLMSRAIVKSSRKQTVQKYESRKLKQQAQFGYDVEQRARDAAA